MFPDAHQRQSLKRLHFRIHNGEILTTIIANSLLYQPVIIKTNVNSYISSNIFFALRQLPYQEDGSAPSKFEVGCQNVLLF